METKEIEIDKRIKELEKKIEDENKINQKLQLHISKLNNRLSVIKALSDLMFT